MTLGVPSPYTVTVHPYPTRFHGGIWTRPVTQSPLVPTPNGVFKPDDFAPAAYARYPFQGVGALGQVLPQSAGEWLLLLAAVGAVAYFARRRGYSAGYNAGYSSGRYAGSIDSEEERELSSDDKFDKMKQRALERSLRNLRAR